MRFEFPCQFYMSHLPTITKFNANIGCVVSLKWSRVNYNHVADVVFHY